ncbi:hypothetical protein BHE74_00011581 [Ensete ventricosum]|nr:hypothetical protein BHE74_00011581 [Ensete ventricosum]
MKRLEMSGCAPYCKPFGRGRRTRVLCLAAAASNLRKPDGSIKLKPPSRSLTQASWDPSSYLFLLVDIFAGSTGQHVVPVVRGRELGGARGAVYGSNKSPRRPHLVTTGVRKWAPAAWVSKSFTESHCVTRN